MFAILPVRDYGDVIGDTIAVASRWATRIFVLDNGSIDDTIDIVQRAARDLENVEFLGVDKRPWSYGFYAVIYNKVKKYARPGDWWYRLDADEFVVGDPRDTLRAVRPPYDTVRASFYSYYFTAADLAAYESDPEGWTHIPLFERIRWYRNDWAEPRFVRHRRFMRWVDRGWRDGPFRVAPELVPLRHYQYRSPVQIEHRLALRATKAEWPHEAPEYQAQFARSMFLPPAPDAPEWHRFIADVELLDYDDGGPLRARPELLPARPPLRGNPRRTLELVVAATPLYRPLVRLRDRV